MSLIVYIFYVNGAGEQVSPETPVSACMLAIYRETCSPAPFGYCVFPSKVRPTTSKLDWAPHAVYCISHGSYRTTLYLYVVRVRLGLVTLHSQAAVCSSSAACLSPSSFTREGVVVTVSSPPFVLECVDCGVSRVWCPVNTMKHSKLGMGFNLK